jgi:hypothetical protein
MHIFFYTKHVAYGIMVLIAMTLLRILYLAPRIKRYIKPCYCYKTMQSIDHLNLNKPERERGLKKKVVELYWKKRRRQKWGKKVPLFYSSHQYWISLRSITLKSQPPHHIGHLASYVCIQIQAMAYISFYTDVVLGENASNLFCLNLLP